MRDRTYVSTVLDQHDPDGSALAAACRALWASYQQASAWSISDVDAGIRSARLAASLLSLSTRGLDRHSRAAAEVRARIRDVLDADDPR